jgi:hypothetical protein
VAVHLVGDALEWNARLLEKIETVPSNSIDHRAPRASFGLPSKVAGVTAPDLVLGTAKAKITIPKTGLPRPKSPVIDVVGDPEEERGHQQQAVEPADDTQLLPAIH